MKYRVVVREVWTQDNLVEADSIEEALAKVGEGDCDTVDNTLEYSHSLDRAKWDVYDEANKLVF
jgi:hypothetical protein